MYTPLLFAGDIKNPQQVMNWLQGELVRISRDQVSAQDFYLLKELTESPARVQEGMVVKASGVPYDWTGTGAGIYARVSNAWVKLN